MRIRRLVLVVALVSGGVIATTAGPAAAAPTIIEYSSGVSAGAQPTGIVTGSDGNLWFTERGVNRIARMTPAGQATEFSAGISPNAGLAGITAGPDGDLWFAESTANKIGRISPTGTVHEYPLPTANAVPQFLTAGPDGRVWFTEYASGKIGRINTRGVISEISSGFTPGASFGGITTGPDGNVWVTESVNAKVARITPAGTVTEFHTGITQTPAGITAGPDGNLWFAEQPNGIGRISPSGTVVEFTSGIDADTYPEDITVGPDGNLWFTEWGGHQIGRITTGGGVLEVAAGITPYANPSFITLGPDAALWFTEPNKDKIGHVGGTSSGLRYHPVVPTRVLDSRTPVGNWQAPLSAGAPRTLSLTATGAVPYDAAAVVMNVTVTNATAPSFLTVFPTGGAVPNASNLNFAAGQTIPNLVTVKLGSASQVSFANAAGSVDVVADVVGYYGGTGGSLFGPITSARVLDSRGSVGGWGSARLGAGAANERSLVVRGVAGVPSNATAVAVNVTATDSTANSFLTVFPDGVAKPNSSTVNFAKGQTIANLAIVAIGTNDRVRFANAVGATHVIVDVVGYFGPTGSGWFHPLAPSRVLDDRVGNGVSGPWGPGVTRGVQVGGRQGMPLDATGFVLNTTATNGTSGSFLTVYPAGVTRPASSNLNFAAGQTIPNLVLVGSNGSGMVNVYNELGSVDVIADAVGYYATS